MSTPFDSTGGAAYSQTPQTSPSASEPFFKTRLSRAQRPPLNIKPPKRERRQKNQRPVRSVLIFISELVAIAAVILGLVSLYDVVAVNSQGNVPLVALERFCALEEQQSYPEAYRMTSAGYSIRISFSQFIVANRARDRLYGTVQSCDNIHRDWLRTFGGLSASFSLTAKLGSGSFSGDIVLVKYISSWVIEYIDPSLRLDSLGTAPPSS